MLKLRELVHYKTKTLARISWHFWTNSGYSEWLNCNNLCGLSLKVLANEDTLLRTHCCSWRFLARANWETFVADTKCFWTKSETFLCPGHKICVRNKCCARGQTGKHLCRQQCVRNNVSSFASTFSESWSTVGVRYFISVKTSTFTVSLCRSSKRLLQGQKNWNRLTFLNKDKLILF